MFKSKKIFAVLGGLLLASGVAFAELPENLSFSVTTDFAYYPLSATQVNNPDAHFAGITGAYSGLEGRVTGNMNYTIPTPLGSNWLVSGANVVLGASLEISPVSVKPAIQATFTPLPFLVFSAGAQAGTGWSLGGLQGMSVWGGPSDDAYNALTPFTAAFLKWWAQGTFQFDTGAILQGDWTHVVMQYSYQIYYEGLSACENQDVWMWQCSGNRVNGLKNYQCGILAYQMPLVLYRVGVMYESDGYLNAQAFENPLYNSTFKSISISPLAQFQFNEKNTLSVLIGFSSRRSYTEEVVLSSETTNTFASREWYFNRVAFSWSYSF